MLCELDGQIDTGTDKHATRDLDLELFTVEGTLRGGSIRHGPKARPRPVLSALQHCMFRVGYGFERTVYVSVPRSKVNLILNVSDVWFQQACKTALRRGPYAWTYSMHVASVRQMAHLRIDARQDRLVALWNLSSKQMRTPIHSLTVVALDLLFPLASIHAAAGTLRLSG